MDLFDLVTGLLVVFIVAAMGLVIITAIDDSHETDRLMKQCLADGRKEYECHGMLDHKNRYTPMMIPIPVGR